MRRRSCLSCRWLRSRRRGETPSRETDENSEHSTSDRRNNNTAEDIPEEEAAIAEFKPTTTSASLRELSPNHSSNEMTAVELHLLSGARKSVQKCMELWRKGVIQLLLFFALCGACGLCLRLWMPPNDLQRFLGGLDLDQYYERMRGLGFDRLEDVVWANEADLFEAGVTLQSHRRRILRHAVPLRTATSTQWLMWVTCAAVGLWMVTVTAFVTGLLMHKGFRDKCTMIALWLGLTVGCRIRMYYRQWMALDAQERQLSCSNDEISPVE